MEVNREEALRCLSIAQKHRNSSNLPSALKFAKKSVALFTTPEGAKMVEIIEQEISISASSGGRNDDSNAEGSGTSTPGAGPSKAKASGVEEHVSEARQRPGHASASTSASTSAKADGKKREYTVKQLEVVKRVKSCKGHQYYEILAVEKTCTDNDVKKAYKKLALALHPDKNGAPGADEAFKMVSKAFQVLSDDNLRAAYDQNPSHDPTQRGGGGGGGFSEFRSRGGGAHRGFPGDGAYGDINPEDLFNAFFGGGMGPMGGGGSPFGPSVFTFGGPGFQTSFGGPGARARAAHAARGTRAGGGGNANENSPFIALLPVILLCAFALLSGLPSLFGAGDNDPAYAFTKTAKYDMGRDSFNWGVRYYVNKDEWSKSGLLASIPEDKRSLMDLVGVEEVLRSSAVNDKRSAEDRTQGEEAIEKQRQKELATRLKQQVDSTTKGQRGGGHYSSKVRSFERGIENVYAQKLRNECDYFTGTIERQIQAEAGFFGIGADHGKIRELRRRTSPACEQLKMWGVDRAKAQGFY